MSQIIQNTIEAINAQIALLEKNAWQGIFITDENGYVSSYNSQLDSEIYAAQTKAIMPAIYDYIAAYGPIIISYNEIDFVLNNKRAIAVGANKIPDEYFVEDEENNFNLNATGKIIEITEQEILSEEQPVAAADYVINNQNIELALTLNGLKNQKMELETELLNNNKNAWKELVTNIQLFITNFSPITFSTSEYGNFEINNDTTDYGIQNDIVVNVNSIIIEGYIEDFDNTTNNETELEP